MRLLRWPLRIGAVLGVAYLYFATLHPHEHVADHPFFSKPGPLVIAHQGGEGLWPANTLYAFEQALALGVDVLEMDLRVTADGAFAVIHDATVDDTTDGRGRIADMTVSEIRQLDAGYYFENPPGEFPHRGRGLRIPILAEVLDRFPGVPLNLEMKNFTQDQARRFCGVLRSHGVERQVLVASFGNPEMKAFREACPEVATSMTLPEGVRLYVLDQLRIASIYRGPAAALEMPENMRGHQLLDRRLLDLTHSYNLKLQVWTVNREEDMRRLVNLGVDGIITDYPDRLLRILGRLPDDGG